MSETLGRSGSSGFLPNLPGFKANKPGSAMKKTYFSFVEGNIFCDDKELPSFGDIEGNNSMGSSILAIGSASKRGMTESGQMVPPEKMGLKMAFQAYFEEGSGDPALEEVRVRKCNITYFLEDNSLMIVERPQMNSGIPQGTLVNRTQCKNPDGSLIMPQDMRLGALLTIFGRQYRLVDCDYATRKYLRTHMNVSESRALTVPRDAYEELRKQVQPGHSEEWGKYHSKKNSNKDFMAASMGRFVDNSGREGFIKFGNDTIKFLCIWDNTNQLYGDKLEFSLTYHLSDDTIEIFAVPSYNSGRDQTFSRLLKRSKLPKSMDNIVPTLSDPVKPDYIHWTDLHVGMSLEVYARSLKVIDADESTRQFYKDYHVPLGPSIKPPPPPVIKFEREIPPPTGYGSEADSLASCGSAAARAAKEKVGVDKTLIFFASLLSGGIDDVDRRFVITFYMLDSTIKVQEPPVRNSGFTGGLFLSRRKATGEGMDHFDETFLWVGAKIKLLRHRFLILGSNDSTLKYMESMSHTFRRSNFYMVLDKLRAGVSGGLASGEFAAKIQGEANDEGILNFDSLKRLIEGAGIFSNDDENLISEHEILTLIRKAGDRRAVTVPAEVLLAELNEPTGRFA